MILRGRRLDLLVFFGAVSLAAVALGWLVCSQSGVPAASSARNVVAWISGAAAAWATGRWAGPIAFKTALVAAPLALAVSLINPGQEGVHRWLDIGPLHINLAFVVLPAAIVGLAVLVQSSSRDRWWPWAAAFAALVLLVLQPDASQATAMALAIIVIAWSSDESMVFKGLAIAAAVAVGAVSWLRPDPILPVPEVEEIISLAWRLSPLAATAAVAALMAAVLAPVLTTWCGPTEVRTPGAALTLYLAATALTPMLGAFPVPLVGVGMSPVLGFWLGVGLLAAAQRISRSDVSASPASGS